ncbi:sulfurtransferase [Magnetospira thiophila]
MLRTLALLLLLCTTPALADPDQTLIKPADLSRLSGAVLLEVVAPGVDPGDEHLPQAVVTHYASEGWTVDYEGLPGMLPPPEALARTVGGLGISETTTVVIVPTTTDDNGYAAATRIFWSLRMLGHQSLYLLDGGLPGYVAQGGPTQSLAPPLDPTDYHATPIQQGLASIDEVRAGESYGTPPIDLRSTSAFMGEVTHPLVRQAGTILDAVSFPPGAFVDPQTGHFRKLSHLRGIFADTLGTPPGPVVLFSDMGYRAAIGWFAVREIMGLPDVRLFDGSMIQWSNQHRDIFNPSNDMGGAIG